MYPLFSIFSYVQVRLAFLKYPKRCVLAIIKVTRLCPSLLPGDFAAGVFVYLVR